VTSREGALSLCLIMIERPVTGGRFQPYSSSTQGPERTEAVLQRKARLLYKDPSAHIQLPGPTIFLLTHLHSPWSSLMMLTRRLDSSSRSMPRRLFQVAKSSIHTILPNQSDNFEREYPGYKCHLAVSLVRQKQPPLARADISRQVGALGHWIASHPDPDLIAR